MEIPRCVLAAGDDDGAYECTCVSGWRGLTCERLTDMSSLVAFFVEPETLLGEGLSECLEHWASGGLVA